MTKGEISASEQRAVEKWLTRCHLHADPPLPTTATAAASSSSVDEEIERGEWSTSLIRQAMRRTADMLGQEGHAPSEKRRKKEA